MGGWNFQFFQRARRTLRVSSGFQQLLGGLKTVPKVFEEKADDAGMEDDKTAAQAN